MNSRLRKQINRAMLVSWYTCGVRIEDFTETNNGATVKISVPESSYHLDVHGNEMAGNLLVKRLRKTMEATGITYLTIEHRVRQGEYWTKEDADRAEKEATEVVFSYYT